MPDKRLQRLEKLEKATLGYVAKEKTRIENEVKYLEDVLKGRTGGAGIQSQAWQKTSQAAQNDLAAYLKEA
jgi:hypothetical protein